MKRRDWDREPLTLDETTRIAFIANGLRVLHTNGCIYNDCPECDYIRELGAMLAWSQPPSSPVSPPPT